MRSVLVHEIADKVVETRRKNLQSFFQNSTPTVYIKLQLSWWRYFSKITKFIVVVNCLYICIMSTTFKPSGVINNRGNVAKSQRGENAAAYSNASGNRLGHN